jgi:WD40 repeat protein
MNSFKAHTEVIHHIKQSPFVHTTDYVATCSKNTTVKIWYISNPSNWTLIRSYSNHSDAVYGLEWISEGTIASGAYDNTIKIWSIFSGETLRTINPNSDVRSLKLLSNGHYLASGLDTGQISIYDIKTGSSISILKGHVSRVNDIIQISDDLLASSSNDNNVRIWNLTTYTTKFNLTGHTDNSIGLKLISSDILASGSWDKSIKLWNITDGQFVRNLTGHTGYIHWSVDLLNNSQALVSGSIDKTIKTWNITTGQCLNTFNIGFQIQTLSVLTTSSKSKRKH